MRAARSLFTMRKVRFRSVPQVPTVLLFNVKVEVGADVNPWTSFQVICETGFSGASRGRGCLFYFFIFFIYVLEGYKVTGGEENWRGEGKASVKATLQACVPERRTGVDLAMPKQNGQLGQDAREEGLAEGRIVVAVHKRIL